jgi:hypothetical protein
LSCHADELQQRGPEPWEELGREGEEQRHAGRRGAAEIRDTVLGTAGILLLNLGWRNT